jgi:uncharacterized repeat protein (TIGR01451 family)
MVGWGRLRVVIAGGAAIACSVIATAAPVDADAGSPACPTPQVFSGTILPPFVGSTGGAIVNAGTPTFTFTASTTDACGWSALGPSLHFWAPDPTWHMAPTSAGLGLTSFPPSSVTKTEDTGTTASTFDVVPPASGVVFVGVHYVIPDDSIALGFGINQSATIPDRLVVRVAPTINPIPLVLPHDNANTPLDGTAWPGDTVTVRDGKGNVVCTAVADSTTGAWSCVATATFPDGLTSLTVTETGTGANNVAFPGLSDAALPDLTGNTVDTDVITSDPAITKVVDDPTPHFGQQVVYTITATNNGPDTAVNVSVTDPLPAGVTHVSHTTTAGTFDPVAGTWSGIGDLAPGAVQTLTITATVTQRGIINNAAIVVATGATDGLRTTNLTGADGIEDWNTNTANDSAEAQLATVPAADVAVTKTVDRATAGVGDIVTFTITVTNLGPDTAMGVVADDAVPVGLELQSATPDVGTFNSATGRWTIGDMAAGATAHLVIVAKVTAPSHLENIVIVSDTGATDGTMSSTEGDDPTNNTARAAVDAAEVEPPVPTTTTAAAPPPPAPAVLPATGSGFGPVEKAAMAFTIASLGVVLVLVARPRRRHRTEP